ncbi:hypothetical protein STCU_05540 [Strigomonas culicis]|uniref:Complex 1 LYR protein domain-containing protein n=1 Tax=Strigomonas culicis TaxID=28005 RepID=S9UFU8_9TRYP|nr:hypothetical protein STCU_05540 [Strigomonas culicis]|eukprot:EPY27798.1 hypothetical protein STCU_05540 [Strigomonas culicis]
MSANPTQASLAKLRSKLIRTARGFRDYNFRSYFVRHVKDDFEAVTKLSADEQKKFLEKEGPAQLRQMQRMVLVNRLYSSQPVYLDKKNEGTAPKIE